MLRLFIIRLATLCIAIAAFANSAQAHSATSLWESAAWIKAPEATPRENLWQAFRKTIHLEARPTQAVARIAVDSKYWLWINGKLVVFEGGLKRGPSPTGTYFDEIDLAPYLRRGQNTLAILTVYFGKDGFSHKSSGECGLLFAAHIDANVIVSGQTWQATVYQAYGTCGPKPNWRLPESNICFDGRRSLDTWQTDDTGAAFGKAQIINIHAENETFGELVKRPIPLFKDYGMKKYRTQTWNDTTRTLTCRLPYNAQVTPYLKVRAMRGGDTIRIRTDHDRVGNEACVTAAYITRPGVQEYESLGWMNGDYVYYEIPQGVTVQSMAYRESGYDTEFTSHFRSNDPFWNELWKRSERTMYVNMRDTYFDCPDRERSQWWGDVVNDIQQSFYVFSPTAWQIVEKGIDELVNWQRPDGTLFSPVPTGNWNKELPCQMLMSVGWYGLQHQAFYSGDYSFVPRVYDRVHRYIHDIWKTDADGMPICRRGEWAFTDWGDHIDEEVFYAGWFYLALKGEKALAESLGRMVDAQKDEQMMQLMERNFNRRFWKGDHYRSPSYQEAEPDDRVQALAVLCGFARKEQYDDICRVMNRSRYASPFIEPYVQLAYFKMARGEEGLKRAREQFSEMLSYKDYTTVFELWKKSASINHGWSSGMTTILAQEVCGIRPTSPGFKTFEVRPQLSGITDIETCVETRYGKIKVHLWAKKGKTHIELTVPKGTTATVCLDGKEQTVMAGKFKM